MIGNVLQGKDWLSGVEALRPSSIDFLYADPPFNTGTAKRTPPNAGKAGRGVEATYDDSFGSTGAFIDWLRQRLEVTIPLIKPTGLICIHVDWRTSHRVRVLLDELLGEDRFVNHLIWCYGLGGSSPRRFARKHDDLLLYCLDPEKYWFDAPRVPATSVRMKGQTKKATDVLWVRGLDSAEGTTLAKRQGGGTDVLDIPSLNNMARERTGYPTQKPLALLDILVRACCPPGGTVLDPCCGSGTTLVAAVMAGRSALGMDISEDAVSLSRRRLAACSRVRPELRPARRAGVPIR